MESNMKDNKPNYTKQKIFDAAVTLFAKKGFHAVGIRELARVADVNSAMLNYYFGGKIGILKEIINTAHRRHREAITSTDEQLTPERHINRVICNFIRFFRDNTELALVAFDTLPHDIPEIIELKKKWGEANIQLLEKLFSDIGLDINDIVQVSIFNGFLANIILTHFRSRYAWEQATRRTIHEFDDAFYDQYAEMLTRFYFSGVRGLVEHIKPSSTQKT
jgi:AcrR family transcriptional regulator